MIIMEKFMAAAATVLLVFCMMMPVRKTLFADRHPWMKKLAGFHLFWGVLLLAAGIVHGILAGRKPAMGSGKLAWMVLVILIFLSVFRKKMKTKLWNQIHRILAAAVCVLTVVHILWAILK